MSGARIPSLAEQGRRLSALRGRIEDILDDAERRARAEPKHAAAFRAQAQAEAAPLIAEGTALRDALLLRARRRAQLAWRVVYVGSAAILLLIAGWWLQN